MRLSAIVFLLCTCVWLTVGDVAHLKSKVKLLGHLAGKVKHHKRGIFSAVPPFKLGHDIPLVTHSVLKPLVVTYPPTATVAAVKVPLNNPHAPRYPVPVGHPVPLPSSHHKIPYQFRTLISPKPDHHYHHHHHHVAPRPLIAAPPPIPLLPAPIPVPATPVVPVASPTVTIGNPFPAPSPPGFIHPAPVAPAPILPPPVIPAPSLPVRPPPLNVFSPVRPHVPVSPFGPPPAFSYAPQLSYVLRPGNAVQTSFFATYPRYPLVNYQTSLIPSTGPAAPAHVDQVLFERPQVNPYHILPQAVAPEGVLEQPAPTVALQPNPTFIHPTQVEIPQPNVHQQPAPHVVPIDHDGWAPVTQPQDNTDVHRPDPNQFTHSHEPQPHFTQEQGTQVFEQHISDEAQYHDYQNQLQHHIQQQIEQNQYDQHINNQHQLRPDYGVPQINQQQHFSQEYPQNNQEYAQNGQEYSQNHEYVQNTQDYVQQAQEFAHQAHEYAQHNQVYSHTNQIGSQQQPNQEYGLPQQLGLTQQGQGLEGRNTPEEGDTQRYHNHIPLGLQLPIDRPLEHFR